jgi:hypothetical protein
VKKLFLPLALVISLHPYEAAAVMPLEIKSEDVYQAGYCRALVEGAVSAGMEQIPTQAVGTVRLHAEDLIRGGDNLHSVTLGEEAARADLVEILGLQSGIKAEAMKDGSLAMKVEDCATFLTEIVETYQGFSCGYGTKRQRSLNKFLEVIREK